MRIGLVTDSLAHLSFDRDAGNRRGTWHRDAGVLLRQLVQRAALSTLGPCWKARRRGADSADAVRDHGLAISALNCSGNPLHPGETGRRHREVTSQTIRLAGMLGVSRVVLMSGCPGGPGDANANWVTTAWPPEAARVLQWQWDEVVIPYWRGLVAEAQAAGVAQAVHRAARPAERLQRGDAVPPARCGRPDGRRQFRSEPSVLDGRRSAGRDARTGRRDLSRACQGHADRSGRPAASTAGSTPSRWTGCASGRGAT